MSTGKKGETLSLQRLMPDSRLNIAERPMQLSFIKSSLFNGLLLIALIGGFAAFLRHLPSRLVQGPATVRIAAAPADTADWWLDGVRLAGAWTLTAPDKRFGGVSALATDSGRLVALTDSGVSLSFAPPADRRALLDARIADLPAGPGSPDRKSNRDSEALLAAGDGGWWVGFENRHGLWRYAAAFADGFRAVDLEGQGFPLNQGIEGLALLDDGRIAAFPEGGGEMLVIDSRSSRLERVAIDGLGTGVSDAVNLPDGRILIVRRPFGAGGFAPEIDVLERRTGGWLARPIARLGLEAFDNVEAIAAMPLAAGATRLWLMTDNDFRASTRTLLVALDLPPAPGRR